MIPKASRGFISGSTASRATGPSIVFVFKTTPAHLSMLRAGTAALRDVPAFNWKVSQDPFRIALVDKADLPEDALPEPDVTLPSRCQDHAHRCHDDR